MEGDASHWRDEQLVQYALILPSPHLIDRTLFEEVLGPNAFLFHLKLYSMSRRAVCHSLTIMVGWSPSEPKETRN